MKPADTSSYGITMQLESYFSDSCCLKKKGISSKMVATVNPLKLELFNEAFLRFFTYFFE